jgi:hypothetical protein
MNDWKQQIQRCDGDEDSHVAMEAHAPNEHSHCVYRYTLSTFCVMGTSLFHAGRPTLAYFDVYALSYSEFDL